MTPMAAKDAPPKGEQRSQFRDLIRARRAELGLSLERFAERAVDPETGATVKAGWIHRLEKGEPVTPPELPQLLALAAACELPLERLQDAAGQQFHGVDSVWSQSGEAKAYVRQLERLSEEQRAQLRLFLDTFAPPEGD